MRSKTLSIYHLYSSGSLQLRRNCFGNKRYTSFLVIFLFTTLSIYIVSYAPIDLPIVENTDICSKLLNIVYNSNRTLCSEQADRRDNKQQIIALSLFGPKENTLFNDNNFTQLILPFAEEAKLLFPTWTIRLYADISTIDRLNLRNLSNFLPNLDLCNVNQIPTLGNVGDYLPGKLWRFLPTLDPMVDFISSRDLDSPLTQREQILIHEFLNSSYLFLTIRDHPLHGIPILGGLWTSALYRDRLFFLRLFSILLDKNKVQQYSLIHDQTFLTELIWPKVKNQTLAFDSYTCQQFHEGYQRSFPTQRPSRDCHLGCVRPCCQNSSNIIMKKPCPDECRPKNHPEWIYC